MDINSSVCFGGGGSVQNDKGLFVLHRWNYCHPINIGEQ